MALNNNSNEILDDPEFLKFCLTYCEKQIEYSKRKGHQRTIDELSPGFYSRDIKELPSDTIEILKSYFELRNNDIAEEHEYKYGGRGIPFTNMEKLIASDFENDLIKKFEKYKKPLEKMLLKRDELGNEIPDRDFFGVKSVQRLTRENFILQVRSGLGFEKDFPYFFRTVLLKEKYEVEPFLHDWYIFANVKNPQNEYGLEASFWNYLENLFWELVIADVDNPKAVNNEMSGSDYEEYCANILSNAGWKVSITKASNDQGVDIVAEIENLKYCIQCKRYSNPVSNKAVQEVYAGKDFYQGTHAVVVSNAGFTKSARDLAKSSGVILISDIELEKLESYQ